MTSSVRRRFQTNYNLTLSPLTAGAVHIRFLHFLLAQFISVFKLLKKKSDINQQDLKFVDLHFVKSE